MSDDDEDTATVPEVMFHGRRVTQFDFSKTAPHSCCIYDKTKEVKVHHKEWFHEVWKQHGWDGESRVVRIEFRCERECLREMGIDCPYAMLDQAMSMWAYSTQKWLRHSEPNGDKNQSRWPTSAAWQVIQNPKGFNDAVPAVREKKVELDAGRAKAGFVGYATSWAVREVFLYEVNQQSKQAGIQLQGMPTGFPMRMVESDGVGFIAWACDPMTTYLSERKAMTFIEIMQEKARRLGFLLVA